MIIINNSIVFNLFLNNQQNKKIGNDRLITKIPIETLMGFGGYINYLEVLIAIILN